MDELESFGARFWEQQYVKGLTSGEGSRGCAAAFKARVINDFLTAHQIRNVIEFGCGDGHQLGLINYPRYTGYDVSLKAVQMCTELYKNDSAKCFQHIGNYDGRRGDLTLSLDVIYHIIEYEIFDQYMCRLFDASTRYVCIYAVDVDDHPSTREACMYHRKFSTWVAANKPEFRLILEIANECGYNTGFYFYERMRT